MRMLIIFFISFVSAGYSKDISVINYGWHAGIVLKIKDINNSILEIEPMFKKFNYIEVGWGDEDFYRNHNPSIWMTLKAGIIPTSSVIHLRAINQNELNKFSEDNIVSLTISEKGFRQLSLFIQNSFAKENDKFIPISKGLYPNSIFYLSSKKYHIFNTCNIWTAQALQSAEIDISPSTSTTTNSLFSQIYEFKNKSQ